MINQVFAMRSTPRWITLFVLVMGGNIHSTSGKMTRTVNPNTVVAAFAKQSVLEKTSRGLTVILPKVRVRDLSSKIVPRLLEKAILSAETKAKELEQKLTILITQQKKELSSRVDVIEVFGPHLFTSKKVAALGRIGDKFLEATNVIKTDLRLGAKDAQVLRAVSIPVLKAAFACTYDDHIKCNPSAKFRTFDGTCNNLDNPVWGSAVTPFERFLAPQYEDGFEAVRTTGIGSGNLLPNARLLSTSYHEASGPADRQVEVTHMMMMLGQLISHDVNMNSLSRAADGSFLRCCKSDGTINTDPVVTALGCRAVPIPSDDPFFTRQCLSFIRALGGPDLQCNVGTREQINQVTHWLDGSVFYGSDAIGAADIREAAGGLLKTATVQAPDGRDLMPEDPNLSGFGCPLAPGSTSFCFKAGDSRVNQNPPLISLHTIFLREHNRVARALALINPEWDNERLYQEARRIVVAEHQHVVYNEYLPILLSQPVANVFGLSPQESGYHAGYDRLIQPAIRNGFMTSGFRSGHSNIDSTFGSGLFFKGHFNLPEVIFDPAIGINTITANLVNAPQQKLDRLKTDQMTNHLFERSPGNGGDLAATNIMRGRDHGIPNYNAFRVLCGLPPATHFFTTTGGLIHHSATAALKLMSIYEDIDDVEAWTAISSELPLNGGVFGPTAACLTGLQFSFLKNGDRFFYENNDPRGRFTRCQLNQLREVTLSRILCDNTGLTSIQPESLRSRSPSNPVVNCASIPYVDLARWEDDSDEDDGDSDDDDEEEEEDDDSDDDDEEEGEDDEEEEGEDDDDK